MEDYMPLALATTGYKLLAITSLLGMGDIVTKDSFEFRIKLYVTAQLEGLEHCVAINNLAPTHTPRAQSL